MQKPKATTSGGGHLLFETTGIWDYDFYGNHDGELLSECNRKVDGKSRANSDLALGLYLTMMSLNDSI